MSEEQQEDPLAETVEVETAPAPAANETMSAAPAAASSAAEPGVIAADQEKIQQNILRARREAQAMNRANPDATAMEERQCIVEKNDVDEYGNGSGTVVSFSGDVYKGNFLEWKRHGYGEQTWKTGESFKGSWDNDQQLEGVFTDINGVVWMGNFMKNKVQRLHAIYASNRPKHLAATTRADTKPSKQGKGGQQSSRASPRQVTGGTKLMRRGNNYHPVVRRKPNIDGVDSRAANKLLTTFGKGKVDMKKVMELVSPKLMIRPADRTYKELPEIDTPGPDAYNPLPLFGTVNGCKKFSMGANGHEKSYLYYAVKDSESPGPMYFPSKYHMPSVPSIALGTAEFGRMPKNINPDQVPHDSLGPLKSTVDHQLHADDQEFPPSAARYVPQVDLKGQPISIAKTLIDKGTGLPRAPRVVPGLYVNKTLLVENLGQSPGPAAYTYGPSMDYTLRKAPVYSQTGRLHDIMHPFKKNDLPGPGSHYPFESQHLFGTPAFTFAQADSKLLGPQENLSRIPYISGAHAQQENLGIFSPGPAAYDFKPVAFPLMLGTGGKIFPNIGGHVAFGPAGAYGSD